MLEIRASKLFDGVSDFLLRDASVIVDDGRITQVHKCGNAKRHGSSVVDLGDATLMPGLIDAHQHLVFDASNDPVGNLAARDDNKVLHSARRAALAALLAGVTTVRDLGDRSFVLMPLRKEFVLDPVEGPELLLAGPPITTPNGHCWFLGGEARGVDGVRDAVRMRVARGVDVIKVMITGGSLTPGSANRYLQYSHQELSAIAEEAHLHGMSVTGHAKSIEGAWAAVSAGFDGIEHGPIDASALEPGIIEFIAAAPTYVTMTACFKRPPEPPDEIQQEAQATFRLMRTAGVWLILASDAGVALSIPHDALPYGIIRLPLIGMSNVEALRCVTSSAASACGIGHRKGTIAAGYDADLIALDGDPVSDLTALLRVAAVFRRGIRVRRPHTPRSFASCESSV